jgi:hypothetical protein
MNSSSPDLPSAALRWMEASYALPFLMALLKIDGLDVSPVTWNSVM